MSYILDALRKSEQERLRGKLPDLKNFGEEDADKAGQHRLAWIIGGALLTLNAVGLGWWLMRSTPVPVAETAPAPTAADTAKPESKGTTSPGTTAVAASGAATTTAPGVAASSAGTPAQPAGVPGAAAPVATPGGVAGQPGAVVAAPGTVVQAPGGVPSTTVLPGTVVQAPGTVIQAPGTVMTTAPAGTVYYVAPATPGAGQQIVVVPGGVAPAGIAPGAVAPAGNVVVMPTVNQPVPQAWESAASGAVVPPPPAPPPPPPVNLDQTLDAAGVGTTPQVSYLPQMDELPAHIRQQIPDMAFSSHMFSSMSKFRSVVINGTRVKEGQQVGNLMVQEITETGVILSLGDTRFQVDVLGKWSQ